MYAIKHVINSNFAWFHFLQCQHGRIYVFTWTLFLIRKFNPDILSKFYVDHDVSTHRPKKNVCIILIVRPLPKKKKKRSTRRCRHWCSHPDVFVFIFSGSVSIFMPHINSISTALNRNSERNCSSNTKHIFIVFMINNVLLHVIVITLINQIIKYTLILFKFV